MRWRCWPGWRGAWARAVRELVFALDAAAAGQQQERALARQAALRGSRWGWTRAAGRGRGGPLGLLQGEDLGTGGCGRLGGKVYHSPGCPDYDKVSAKHRVVFQSREEAEQAGYRKAKNCP